MSSTTSCNFDGFTAAPESLLSGAANANRTVSAGRFHGSIANLSTAHWDGNLGVLSRRRLQRKSWVYGAVFSPRWIIGCAVVDAGLISSAFIYVYDRQTQQFIERKAMRPLAFARDFKPQPNSVWTLSNSKEHWRIAPISKSESNGWQFQFDSADLKIDFTLFDNGSSISALNNSPSSSHPNRSRPFHYTHKIAGLPAKLSLQMNGEHFNSDDAHEQNPVRGVFDFTLGYPPRSTLWQWLSWTGTLNDGRKISGNLVAQTMNGLENTVWLENTNEKQLITVIGMPQTIFDYDPQNMQRAWHIHTVDQRLILEFIPEGMRSESIHLGILASDFIQPFGCLKGIWKDTDGHAHAFTGIGVVEQHRALW